LGLGHSSAQSIENFRRFLGNYDNIFGLFWIDNFRLFNLICSYCCNVGDGGCHEGDDWFRHLLAELIVDETQRVRWKLEVLEAVEGIEAVEKRWSSRPALVIGVGIGVVVGVLVEAWRIIRVCGGSGVIRVCWIVVELRPRCCFHDGGKRCQKNEDVNAHLQLI